ncbi:MAG: hypothetical protein KGI38_10000 [Thaumarchaeota archaeon]|nr:hypothetical protein [Nitrososphaerota archaeon]
MDFYVMFLFNEQKLLSREQLKIQDKLQETFRTFGREIGMKALAISLVKEDGRLLDVEKDREYQDKFGLDSAKAPHIVVLDTHPDDWTPGNRIVRFSLNRTPSARLYIILDDVADLVRRHEILRHKLKLRMIYEGMKKWLNDHRKDLREGAEVVGQLKNLAA